MAEGKIIQVGGHWVWNSGPPEYESRVLPLCYLADFFFVVCALLFSTFISCDYLGLVAVESIFFFKFYIYNIYISILIRD